MMAQEQDAVNNEGIEQKDEGI
jgi:hypothetical protein